MNLQRGIMHNARHLLLNENEVEAVISRQIIQRSKDPVSRQRPPLDTLLRTGSDDGQEIKRHGTLTPGYTPE